MLVLQPSLHHPGIPQGKQDCGSLCPWHKLEPVMQNDGKVKRTKQSLVVLSTPLGVPQKSMLEVLPLCARKEIEEVFGALIYKCLPRH